VVCFFLLAFGVANIRISLLSHCIAGLMIFQAWIVMFQTIQLVMRCFQMLIRNQNDDDAMTGFNFQNFATFFIQQEGCNIDRT
jgi:hypothetical protein